jgi:hypothetical protein
MRRLQGLYADRTDRNPKQRTDRPPRCSLVLIGRPVSGLTSAHESCWQIAFPRPKTQWLFDSPLLVYRCGGSAGFGSVKRLKHAPASRFTRRRSRSKPKTPAKHLTTSEAMLTAVKAISKLPS